MWVFFSLLIFLALLLFGKFCLKIENIKGRERFLWLTLSFCGIAIYRGLFALHFKHVVRPQIIKVKKAGFRKIYAATIRKDVKKYDFRYLIRSRDFRKIRTELWIGTGDAAHTAALCGVLQTIANSFAKSFELKNTYIAIRPDFDHTRCSLWIDGIVCLSLADIITRFIKEMRQKFYASNRKRIKYHHVGTEQNG